MKQRSQGPPGGGINTQHKHTALTRSNIRCFRDCHETYLDLTAFGKGVNISIKSLGFDKFNKFPLTKSYSLWMVGCHCYNTLLLLMILFCKIERAPSRNMTTNQCFSKNS